MSVGFPRVVQSLLVQESEDRGALPGVAILEAILITSRFTGRRHFEDFAVSPFCVCVCPASLVKSVRFFWCACVFLPLSGSDLRMEIDGEPSFMNFLFRITGPVPLLLHSAVWH
ncbi:uncharacterized protein ACNS7B_021822 [Menidia menidia]